jgi:hypothetical protein
MGEISMSGSTRERGAAVLGPTAFHPVLSSLLYRFKVPWRIHRLNVEALQEPLGLA